MNCLHCGEALSWLQRLKNERYCSPKHREIYLKRRDSSAFDELLARSQGAANGKEEEPLADGSEEVVSAEAIEDAETCRLLTTMGVNYGQGYHLAATAGAPVLDGSISIQYRTDELMLSGADEDALRVAATSLAGGNLGGE